MIKYVSTGVIVSQLLVKLTVRSKRKKRIIIGWCNRPTTRVSLDKDYTEPNWQTAYWSGKKKV